VLSDDEPQLPEDDRPIVNDDWYLRRWLRTWVVLGAVVVFTVAAFLAVIGDRLAAVNDDLAVTDRAVSTVSGGPKTLPEQIAAVNASLDRVNAALNSLPNRSKDIAASLATMKTDLSAIDTALRSADPRLVTGADNLQTADNTLGPLKVNLARTSSLLAAVLGSTGGIADDLAALDSKSTGVRAFRARIRAINEVLAASRSDLGDILTQLNTVNGHLTNICHAPVVNLAHGIQSC
jgi:DNA-binding FrmR family transcriptional regulator